MKIGPSSPMMVAGDRAVGDDDRDEGGKTLRMIWTV